MESKDRKSRRSWNTTEIIALKNLISSKSGDISVKEMKASKEFKDSDLSEDQIRSKINTTSFKKWLMEHKWDKQAKMKAEESQETFPEEDEEVVDQEMLDFQVNKHQKLNTGISTYAYHRRHLRT